MRAAVRVLYVPALVAGRRRPVVLRELPGVSCPVEAELTCYEAERDGRGADLLRAGARWVVLREGEN